VNSNRDKVQLPSPEADHRPMYAILYFVFSFSILAHLIGIDSTAIMTIVSGLPALLIALAAQR